MKSRFFDSVKYGGFTIIAALALGGCQTTKYVTTHCLTAEQYNELREAEPPKVSGQLTGRADQDIKPIAGSAVRLRAWGRGLLGVLGGCVEARPQ